MEIEANTEVDIDIVDVATGDGRDDEEIGRDDHAHVILQEGEPGLGWWLAPAPHVFATVA